MLMRRADPLFIQIDYERRVDFKAFFQGQLSFEQHPRCRVDAPRTGCHGHVDGRWLAWLADLPAQGISVEQALASGIPAAMLEQGLAEGWLEDASAVLTVPEVAWDPVALYYQHRSRWSEQSGDEASRSHTVEAHRARLSNHCATHGDPPPELPSTTTTGQPLPTPDLSVPLLATLRARSTCRQFDTTRPLPIADLSQVLAMVYGVWGEQELAPGCIALKRTSPSGGSLHPVVPVVLVRDVATLAPGLYDYDGREHTLALRHALAADEAAATITRYSAGQAYFADSHAVVIQVARFERAFWKYRHHAKGLKAVLLDAGHLSQTWYLAATALGLGAWYTAAINDAQIDADLQLTNGRAAAIGLHGLGLAQIERGRLHFDPEPRVPGLQASSRSE